MPEIIDISPEMQKVCYELPTSVDPSVFGPKYWEAFHDLASRIRCGGCRETAESFMVFFHDLTNKHLNKPIQDKANFDKWTNRISETKKIKEQRIIGAVVVILLIIIIGVIAVRK